MLDPKKAALLNSLEGIYIPRRDLDIQWVFYKTISQKVNSSLEYFGTIMPGLILAMLLALAGIYGAQWLGESVMSFQKSPISGVMVAIILGLLIRNLLGLPEVYFTGLRFCVKKILRIGVALLGIRLSIMAVGKISILSLPVVFICILCALLIVSWINNRMGLPRRLGSLIAVGSSICGATAIVAIGPIIEAEDDEVTYAVACIAIFGMIAMLVYPFLSFFLFDGNPQLAGVFLGTAIHDTSQVAGAGMMYQQQFNSPEALNIAAVTKLIRNLFMIAVIPLMAILYRPSGTSSNQRTITRWYNIIPLFIIGFLVMAIVRTLGDIGDKPFLLLSNQNWEHFISFTKSTASWCLTIAMAAVGLGTSIAKIKNLGFKPFFVGLIAATLVGVVSFTMLQIINLRC